MGELPGRNVAKTGKGQNWKSRGRGKEKNMVVEYIPLSLRRMLNARASTSMIV